MTAKTPIRQVSFVANPTLGPVLDPENRWRDLAARIPGLCSHLNMPIIAIMTEDQPSNFGLPEGL